MDAYTSAGGSVFGAGPFDLYLVDRGAIASPVSAAARVRLALQQADVGTDDIGSPKDVDLIAELRYKISVLLL